MKTEESTSPFTDCESLADLLQQWKELNQRPHEAKRNLDGIRTLLQRWEDLDRQAVETSESFGKHATQVRTMLHKVSKRIDSGSWHTTGWNIFEILGRVRLEDAHSDMLAWLFKPWEAHGLGSRFLSDFVRTATGNSLPNDRVREVETRKKVCPGGEKIDIEVQGDGWVLAVENKIDHVETHKIDHAETLSQTEYYARHYRSLEQMGTVVFAVFLTLKGDPAEAKDFRPMSYGTLRRILVRLRGSSDTTQVVQWFADHIRKNLEVTK